MPSIPSHPVPFVIKVDQSALNDLNDRLTRVRLPRDFANDDWGYGTNTEYLKELIEYWIDRFDWRDREREMNEFSHYKTEIAGQPIHFIRQSGEGPKPIPLILTHGWPWTFWDYRHVIGPLSDPAAYGGDPEDAFDVIVPSLPGFIFSTPTSRALNWVETADLWATLMRDQLGYNRFAAAGSDWGLMITSQLGHKYPDNVAGIHLTGGRALDLWNSDRPWDLFGQMPLGEGQEKEDVLAYQRRFAGHVTAHVLEAQTLAHAFHDSPTGLASWLVERRRSWSDCGGDVERRFSKDDLLTSITLYWVTESFFTSARFYRDATLRPWVPSHHDVPMVPVPTAISIFKHDVPRIPDKDSYADLYNLNQFRVHDRGGHFAAAEEPETIVQDLRDAFRHLR